jgi:hypothetical protein
MIAMDKRMAACRSCVRTFAALLAIVTWFMAWSSMATAIAQSRDNAIALAQNSAPEKAEKPVTPVPAMSPPGTLWWTFDGAQPAASAGWSTERGTMTLGDGAARLQPDRSRRVVLLSPPGLPDAVRSAGEFVLGVSGTGLERIHILARRDPRGGWITIADASGAAMGAVGDGFAIKRGPGARDAPIERLRFDLTFRTTNARPLTRIAVDPAPR